MLVLFEVLRRKMLTCWKSFAIGIVGDAGVRGSAQQPRLYVGMILILIFAEVLGRTSVFFSLRDVSNK